MSSRAKSEFGNVEVNKLQVGQRPFSFQVPADSIESLNSGSRSGMKTKMNGLNFFEIPLKKDLPQ